MVGRKPSRKHVAMRAHAVSELKSIIFGLYAAPEWRLRSTLMFRHVR
jgi:hypothetical protein